MTIAYSNKKLYQKRMAAFLEICKLDPRATFLFDGDTYIRKIHVLTMFSLILEFCFRGGARGPFSPPRLMLAQAFLRIMVLVDMPRFYGLKNQLEQ